MGGLPLSKGRDQFRQFVNFAEQRWVSRALLVELDAWTRGDREPPPSQYPAIAKGELVPLEDVHFPQVPSFPFTEGMYSMVSTPFTFCSIGVATGCSIFTEFAPV